MRKSKSMSVALAALVSAASTALAAPFAYVPGSGDSSLTVVDTATDSVVTTIAIPGPAPRSATVSPDGYRVFVGDGGGFNGKIHVVDAVTNTVTKSIAVFSGIGDLAVTPDGTRLYATGGSSVKAVDLTTETFITFISDPTVLVPDGIAIHPTLPRAYAAAGGFDSMLVIDTSTNTVVTTISQSERSIAMHPDGTRGFGIIACTFCSDPPHVMQFDTATNTNLITRIVTTGVPIRLGIHPDGTPLFAATDAVVLSRMDTGSNTETLAVAMGTDLRGVTVHPDGSRVYVADRLADEVLVVDPTTLAILDTIPVGDAPYAHGAFIGPLATCGDATLTFPESCDDGGTDPGDGCAADCTVEDFCECTGEPSACSCGTEIPVSSRKLIVVDKLTAASKAKLVYVAKDPGVDKGAGTDVEGIEIHFSLAYDSASGAFTLPAGSGDATAGWKVNRSTVAKYVNKAAPAGPTGVKVGVVKPGKLLKIVGKTLGDAPLDLLGAGAPVGDVVTRYVVTNDGEHYLHCSRFEASGVVYKEIAGGTGAKLVAKNGVPAACP
jgi:YVTN family beta-propeller protein/cysteine-rich repeat protein